MEGSNQDGDNRQRKGFWVKVSEKDALKFDRMFSALDSFVFKEVTRVWGLDCINQFAIYVQRTKRCDEILPGEAKRIFHWGMGDPKNNKAKRRTSLPYLSV
jgi:hypothetical protein